MSHLPDCMVVDCTTCGAGPNQTCIRARYSLDGAPMIEPVRPHPARRAEYEYLRDRRPARQPTPMSGP